MAIDMNSLFEPTPEDSEENEVPEESEASGPNYFEPRRYYPEQIVLIEEDDGFGWIPELAGRAVFRRNHSNHEGDIYIDPVSGAEIPVSIPEDNNFTLYLYIPSDVKYNLEFGTPGAPNYMNGRKFNIFDIFDITDITTVEAQEIKPVCRWLIPSSEAKDQAVEMYDYPYTMFPIKDTCIAEKLGNNIHSPGTCPHATKGTFDACAGYQEFKRVKIGMLGDMEVEYYRQYSMMDIVAEYNVGDQTFATFEELKAYAAEIDQKLEIEWSPLGSPRPFMTQIVENLQITYPRENHAE